MRYFISLSDSHWEGSLGYCMATSHDYPYSNYLEDFLRAVYHA
jgi:hypothetical protein